MLRLGDSIRVQCTEAIMLQYFDRLRICADFEMDEAERPLFQNGAKFTATELKKKGSSLANAVAAHIDY